MKAAGLSRRFRVTPTAIATAAADPARDFPSLVLGPRRQRRAKARRPGAVPSPAAGRQRAGLIGALSRAATPAPTAEPQVSRDEHGGWGGGRGGLADFLWLRVLPVLPSRQTIAPSEPAAVG